MTSKKILGLLCTFIVLSAGCGKKLENKTEVLVTIGSEQVSMKEFDEAYASASRESARFPVDRETSLKLKAAFLNQLIEETLILIEAERLKLSVSKEELDAAVADVKKDYADEKTFQQMLISEYINFDKWREKLKRRLLIEKVISLSVASQIKIKPEDVEEYYNKNLEEFQGDEQVRARQILVRDEATAQKAKNRIDAGESFAAVAMDVSMSPDAASGGDLGYFTRGVMPQEFDDVVFTLEKGVISDVINTPYGYHLFLVEDHQEQRSFSLDEVRDKIVEHLRREWEEYLYSRWIEGLRKETKIIINDEALKRSIRVK